jgi:serine/threonine protein kinase
MADIPPPRDSSSGPVRPSAAPRPLPPSSSGNPGGGFLPPVQANYIGRTLGQYQIQEKIGQGGMGLVFKAFDTALERTVALKVLFLNPIDDPRQSERFVREARSLARLSHPNLLHVYNVGAESDCYFFAMELLQGITLSAALRARGKIPAAEFVPALGQILSALQYVHEQGVTHRDIKSGNIMLCENRAVLMDFGLAKDEHYSGLTSVGAVMGTPDYMSPEAAEGLSEGPPTDLYSLGVVTFEALSGRLPFTGRSALSIIRQHVDAPPPSLAAFNPDADPLLVGIVHKLLQKNPSDRYPHCPAVAADLKRFLPTSELTQLAERKGLIAAKPVRGTGTFEPVTGRHPENVPTLLSGAAMPLDQGTIADGPVRSENFADAATVIQSNPRVVPAASISFSKVKPVAGWPWWVSGAVGFFGVLAIVFVIALLARKNKGPESWTGQLATHKKANGTTEEIRWIEFKSDPDPAKWQDVIERRQPDGTWQRATVPHSEFAGKNDTLEFQK